MAQFLPNHFELLLTSPINQLNSNSHAIKVSCMIKTDQMFTDNIQSFIKFSIKNTSCKDCVSYFYYMEDSKLSEDKKSFSIFFLAQQPGMHLVSVLLYGQHITNSPLTIPVTMEKSPQTVEQIPVRSADQTHNPSPVNTSQAPKVIIPTHIHIVAPPPAISSSPPAPSPPLDLQLHCLKANCPATRCSAWRQVPSLALSASP